MNLGSGDMAYGEALDAAFLTILTTKLMTQTTNTLAYKMGLIKRDGSVIREPKTPEERRALTYMDRIAFGMKKTLGGRVAVFYRMYRNARTNPNFMRALSRMSSHRFTRYHDTSRVAYQRKPDANKQTATGGVTSTFRKPLG